jgi:hypothetical protein
MFLSDLISVLATQQEVWIRIDGSTFRFNKDSFHYSFYEKNSNLHDATVLCVNASENVLEVFAESPLLF